MLQADGGTRTAAITGAYVALADAVRLAAGPQAAGPAGSARQLGRRGVGRRHRRRGRGSTCMYEEDVRAETDMNVVATGDGEFVEVQGTAEGAPFRRAELDALLDLAVGSAARELAQHRRPSALAA